MDPADRSNELQYIGVPPLALLFGIVLFSTPWVRHRFYETFYHLHLLMAVTYVGLMFWHAGLEGDSWNYLWATIAVWLASILARVFWFNRAFNLRTEWFHGSATKLQALPGAMSRLTISVPAEFHWNAGQHMFPSSTTTHSPLPGLRH